MIDNYTVNMDEKLIRAMQDNMRETEQRMIARINEQKRLVDAIAKNWQEPDGQNINVHVMCGGVDYMGELYNIEPEYREDDELFIGMLRWYGVQVVEIQPGDVRWRGDM